MNQYKCKNCNQNTHNIASCPQPIKSYGIACYKPPSTRDGSGSILLVRRKHSIDFIDFLRGEYFDIQTQRIHNLSQLTEQFRKMTHEEHRVLVSMKQFSTICDYANLYCHGSRQLNSQYINAFDIFNRISIGIKFPIHYQCNAFRPIVQQQLQPIRQTITKNILTLDSLLLNNPAEYDYPEYSVPKGRKDSGETDLSAAFREFKEETGIDTTHISLCMSESKLPISYTETYKGSNDRLYQSIIYVATINKPDITLQHTCDEIGAISWVKQPDLKYIIRPYHTKRIEILNDIFDRFNQPNQLNQS